MVPHISSRFGWNSIWLLANILTKFYSQQFSISRLMKVRVCWFWKQSTFQYTCTCVLQFSELHFIGVFSMDSNKYWTVALGMFSQSHCNTKPIAVDQHSAEYFSVDTSSNKFITPVTSALKKSCVNPVSVESVHDVARTVSAFSTEFGVWSIY